MKPAIKTLVVAMALLAAVCGIVSGATVTQEITYQGRLTDAAGNPRTGAYSVTFSIYETATSGTALATSTQTVTCTNGLFTTPVAFDKKYFDGRALWLGIKAGTDPEMTPRQEIRPVPYALGLRPGAWITATGALPALDLLNSGGGTALNVTSTGVSGSGIVVLTAGKSGTGITATTAGQSTRGVFAYADGDGSTGVYASADGRSSTGVVAYAGGEKSKGIATFTYSDNSNGVFAYTGGDNSDGIRALTQGQSSPGINASTTGSRSDGVVASTSGPYSHGITANTTGGSSTAVAASTRGDHSPGITVSTIGSQSGGIVATTDGDWSTGITLSTNGQQSNGVSVFTDGEYSDGITAYNSGYYCRGVYTTMEGSYSKGLVAETNGPHSTSLYAVTFGESSPGANIFTTKQSSQGVFVQTVGTNSEGISVDTFGAQSDGIVTNTTGYDSDGVLIKTAGEYSNGVFASTTGYGSDAVVGISAQNAGVSGKGREGGIFTTNSAGGGFGDPHAGIGVTTSYPWNPGVRVRTTGDSSYGTWITTQGAFSPAVYAIGNGDHADGVQGYAYGTDSAGVTAYSEQNYGIIANTNRPDHKYGIYTDDYLYAKGTQVPATDVAEYMPVRGNPGPGTVLVIGADRTLEESSAAYDIGVAGIVSTAPGISLGVLEEGNPGEVLVAVAGRVPCRVDASNGPIHPRDLLTTSENPGYAMKATNPQVGTILGKSMGTLESGTGVIEVLVTLQ